MLALTIGLHKSLNLLVTSSPPATWDEGIGLSSEARDLQFLTADWTKCFAIAVCFEESQGWKTNDKNQLKAQAAIGVAVEKAQGLGMP